MFITVQQLERHPLNFNVTVEPGEFEFDGKTAQVSPLLAEGTATLLNHALGEIRVQGLVKVLVSAPCDRCLEQANVAVEKQFDLVYMPASEAAGNEKEVEEAATEVGYYEGSSLALNDILREVVLLALPMQLVCEEACRGICPVCGQNRNLQDCSCHLSTSDDRWNGLKDFRPRTA